MFQRLLKDLSLFVAFLLEVTKAHQFICCLLAWGDKSTSKLSAEKIVWNPITSLWKQEYVFEMETLEQKLTGFLLHIYSKKSRSIIKGKRGKISNSHSGTDSGAAHLFHLCLLLAWVSGQKGKVFYYMVILQTPWPMTEVKGRKEWGVEHASVYYLYFFLSSLQFWEKHLHFSTAVQLFKSLNF